MAGGALAALPEASPLAELRRHYASGVDGSAEGAERVLAMLQRVRGPQKEAASPAALTARAYYAARRPIAQNAQLPGAPVPHAAGDPPSSRGPQTGPQQDSWASAGVELSDVPQQDGAVPMPETILTDFAMFP